MEARSRVDNDGTEEIGGRVVIVKEGKDDGVKTTTIQFTVRKSFPGQKLYGVVPQGIGYSI